MKIRFYLLLPLLCATLVNATIVWDGNSLPWTAGSGTEADPYLIETPQHLAWLSDMLTAKKSNYAGTWFRQTDDFDMNASQYTWVRIGSESYTFQGNYDGDSYTITNITGGLFGTLSGATVKNVTITNAIGTSWITKGNSVDYAGALAKRALSSTISQCFNKSSITCSYYINMSTYVGGLIGAVEDCTLTRCGSEGDIVQSSSDNTGRYSYPTIGGLIGRFSSSTLTECYSKGDLRAQTVYCSVGGLVGALYADTQSSIVRCYSVGSVAGSRNDYGTIGGFFADIINPNSGRFSSMQNCYCVTSLGVMCGYGLCPMCNFLVTNSYFCNLGIPNDCGINASEGTERTESQIKAASFPIMLDENYFVADTYGVNNGYPIFTWQIPHYATVTTVYDTKVGTVTGAGEYQIGEFSTLTATPNPGYRFVQWDDGNTDNPRTIKVRSDTTLAAEFEKYISASSSGSAEVLSSAGRTSCEYVQLWENGPKWATFNVGATIMDYVNLSISTDSVINAKYEYYNTANVGGLYAWNQPNYNGRKTTWKSSVTTGEADVATTLWGSNWKTPTREQLEMLYNNSYGKTVWTWCNGSDVQYVPGCTLCGYKVSGVGSYAGKSIFLPAAGYFICDKGNGTIYETSYGCDYWSSTMRDDWYAYVLQGYVPENTGGVAVRYEGRYIGLSLRAVLVEREDTLRTYTVIGKGNNSTFGTVIGSNSYVETDLVTLTATPNTGYHFLQWSDGNTDNPRTITVTSDTTLMAEFAINQYTVTLANDAGYGSVIGDGTYGYNTQVALTATPNAGYHFLRWSDGNTENPRTITVTSDTTLMAEFAINQYTVTLSANDTSYGSVLGDDTYDYNTQATLIATPNTGYHFVRWSDGNTDNPRTITVTEDITLTAEFEADVVLPSSGSAEVLSTSGRTSCEWVQLWEGGPKWATFNVGATITDYANLTVGADATSCYNNTAQAPYYNTANCGGLYAWNQPNYNGRQTTWTESVTTGVADVATTLWGSNWKTPTRQQLDTLQNSSYGKTTWTWCDGSSTQYVPGCTLKGYKVSGVGAYAEKSIFLPAAGYFNCDDGTVYRASGYGRYWSSTMDGSDYAWILNFNSGNRNMSNDFGRDYGLSVRAVLADEAVSSNTYTITVLANDSTYGIVTGGGNYEENLQATLTATPNTGYHFVRWSDGNTDNPRTITVTEDITLTAEFKADVVLPSSGSAEVLSSAGRTSCEWVQLWEGGPKWATFNVGATINHYASLTYGADSLTIGDDFIRISDTDQAPYYNTANVGGLYAWQQPNYNGRKTTWSSTVSTGVADVATTLWGSNWRTPTREQLDTLQNSELGKTIWTWCDGRSTQYVLGCKLAGYKVSGVGAYADNSIFLPAAGYFYNNDRVYEGASDNGFYWANTLYDSEHAYYLRINSYNREVAGDISYGYDCRDGRSVRAVLDDGTVVHSVIARPNNFLYGTVMGGGTYVEGSRVSLTAKPVSGFKFVQWSDGNTENPRTIIVTEDISLTAEFARIEHEYVDLGLPSGTLWATKNLTPENVTGPTDSFYAWGATSSSGSGTWENYRFGKSESSLTKYCVDAQYGANGFTDSKTRLEATDDAATKLWGEEWRIPTYEDWQELLACCTPVSEGYARELRSKSNGATIRFHLSGYHVNNHLEQYERQGAYWTADLYAPRCYDATAILFDGDNIMPFHALRCWGLSIRPVRKPAGKSPQAMSEDVETILSEPVVVTKRIIDGTLYIIRDGHRYTTQGLLVE